MVYFDFFIGEALYKNSLFESTPQSNILLQEAEIYLTKHNQNISQSRLYLANIYASQKKYIASFAQYNLLLENSAYFKNKNLVFNYIQLAQLLKKDNIKNIVIQAIDSQDSLKENKN